MRSHADSVELVADPAGSRTIWYALTDERLIASTSQRAIVAVLGSFAINKDAIGWMLSSGTLGPPGAWDARFEHLRPGERVTLDRQRWQLTRSFSPAAYIADHSLSEAQHLERLTGTVQAVCRRLKFDMSKWPLPLSGGVDSRGLLLQFRDRPGLKTITWGTAAARRAPTNDAHVACTLAKALGVRHHYYVTDLSAEPRERLMSRFLTAGEGRVALISGYTDGFLVWKTLFEEGVDGIIRGDETFGSIPVPNAYNVRFRQGITVMSDYFKPAELASFELPEQRVPDDLIRPLANETRSTWRDRGYLEFRIPKMLAGLTDLKAAYVEVANPLLARAVLDVVRTLPDKLRTNKRLWRRVVLSQSPDIPFATGSAVLQLGDFLKDSSVMQLLVAEMESASAQELFAPSLRARILAMLAPSSDRRSAPKLFFRVSAKVPQGLKTTFRHWVGVKAELPPSKLAFRAFIASRMNALLQDDATSLRSIPP